MDMLSLYDISSEQLSKVPFQDGQLIFLNDQNGMYYDLKGQRHSIKSQPDMLWISEDLSNLDKDDLINIENITNYSLPYRMLEFVFIDSSKEEQFTSSIYGISEGQSKYSYSVCPNFTASKTYNMSMSQESGICIETVSVSGSISDAGVITIGSKQRLIENTVNGTTSMTNEDLLSENSVGLVMVLGWR